jgi:cellulose synthase/poly-beta-1,6-N-acetylglucosamine synthase-like glycosyltransferase
MENIVTVYETFLAYYSVGYILLYLILAILSWIAIRRYFQSKYFLPKEILIKSNTVGVSIIAPAFNEDVTIVYNVKSLLSQEYLNLRWLLMMEVQILL